MNIYPSTSVLATSNMTKMVTRLVDIDTAVVNNDGERDLLGDVFMSLYDSTAVVSPSNHDDGRLVNTILVSYLHQHGELQNLRRHTAGSICQSLATAPMLHAHLLNDETLKEAMKQQEQINEMLRTAEVMEMSSHVYKDAGQHEHKLMNLANNAQNRADELRAQANELANKALGMINKFMSSDFKQAGLSTTIASANEVANDVATTMSG